MTGLVIFIEVVFCMIP